MVTASPEKKAKLEIMYILTHDPFKDLPEEHCQHHSIPIAMNLPNLHPKAQHIILPDGTYIDLPITFPYLDNCVLYNLQDDVAIDERIKKAIQAMGRCKCFFRSWPSWTILQVLLLPTTSGQRFIVGLWELVTKWIPAQYIWRIPTLINMQGSSNRPPKCPWRLHIYCLHLKQVLQHIHQLIVARTLKFIKTLGLSYVRKPWQSQRKCLACESITNNS